MVSSSLGHPHGNQSWFAFEPRDGGILQWLILWTFLMSATAAVLHTTAILVPTEAKRNGRNGLVACRMPKHQKQASVGSYYMMRRSFAMYIMDLDSTQSSLYINKDWNHLNRDREVLRNQFSAFCNKLIHLTTS